MPSTENGACLISCIARPKDKGDPCSKASKTVFDLLPLCRFPLWGSRRCISPFRLCRFPSLVSRPITNITMKDHQEGSLIPPKEGKAGRDNGLSKHLQVSEQESINTSRESSSNTNSHSLSLHTFCKSDTLLQLFIIFLEVPWGLHCYLQSSWVSFLSYPE